MGEWENGRVGVCEPGIVGEWGSGRVGETWSGMLGRSDVKMLSSCWCPQDPQIKKKSLRPSAPMFPLDPAAGALRAPALSAQNALPIV